MQKEADAMQEEMHDKITVAFSKNCYKRGIEAMNASRKDNSQSSDKRYEIKQQKIRNDDRTKPDQIR